MDILPGKRFYVDIKNLVEKPLHLPKFMIIETASNAPSCMKHPRDYERFTMEIGGQASTPCVSENSIHLVHYKPPER